MFDQTAQTIWDRQYAITPNESILEGLYRASGVTQNPRVRDLTFAMMASKRFSAGGRILAGAGTKHRNVLNCFRAGTLVHTDQGAVAMETLVGQTVNVLSAGGIYRPALFGNYGKQELMKVSLGNGEVIYATPDHDWLVTTKKTRLAVIRTKNLEGHRIPQVKGKRPERNGDYEDGVRHGIIFGDGSRYGRQKANTQANLFGKKMELGRFFSESDASEKAYGGRQQLVVTRQDSHFKDLPADYETASYWYGFLSGLLATDGCVDTRGSVILGQANPEVLYALQRHLPRIGIGVSSIKVTRTHSPYDGSEKPLFSMRFVSGTFEAGDFVREDQRERFATRGLNNGGTKTQSIKVVSVEATDLVEDVYCCNEPETHTIVVGGGYLTRQCFVLSPDSGRYDSLKDARDMALKNALITKVGGGTGENLDPFPSKEHAVIPAPPVVYGYLSAQHPDADHFYAWEYRDISRSKGTDWLSPPRRALKLTGFPVADTATVVIPDSQEGIVNAAFNMLDLVALGRPVTLDFSLIRPDGSEIKGSGGTASGPSSFAIELFDNVLHWYSLGGISAGPVAWLRYVEAPIKRVTRQGGVRRGAGMATIRITHPDWLDFVTSKDQEREAAEGDISTYNISFLFPDDFIAAFKAGEPDAVYRMTTVAEHAWKSGEPGLLFVDTINRHNLLRPTHGEIVATNPCQPANAPILTPSGLKTLGDIGEGDFIWSESGWTKVAAKWSTGIKPVYRYHTTAGYFLGTENHRVVEGGTKVEAGQAEGIDLLTALHTDPVVITPRIVMAGLVIGDGMLHPTSRNPKLLCVGQNDQGYFGSEIAPFLEREMSGAVGSWHVTTDVTEEELRLKVTERVIPDRYVYADADTQASFLRGLYSANGSICGNRVTLKTTSFEQVRQIQLMLSCLGIASYYTTNKPTLTKWANGDYVSRESYDVNIGRLHGVLEFQRLIGFIQKYKNEKLAAMVAGKTPRSAQHKATYDVVGVDFVGDQEVFDITVTNDTHTYWTGGVNVSNCGEVTLYPGEPCDLGAINLGVYVEGGEFDTRTFVRDVTTALDYLDDNLDYSNHAVEQTRVMSMRNRRLGLGVMGLADALIKLGLRYGSLEAQKFTLDIATTMSEVALDWSESAAILKGEPEWSIDARAAGLIEVPRRNVATLTVAPTGTTAMIMGASSGLEPIFSPFIYRKVGDTYLSILHPLFLSALQEHIDALPAELTQDGVALNETAIISALQGGHGSVRDLDWVPQAVREVFVFAHDVTPQQHVAMQGAMQKGFDSHGNGNSLSKTVNMPNSATVQDVLDTYLLAWEVGCKGVTVYRDGSRQFQVLSTSSAEEEAKPVEVAAQPVEDDAAKQAIREELEAACATGACEMPSF